MSSFPEIDLSILQKELIDQYRKSLEGTSKDLTLSLAREKHLEDENRFLLQEKNKIQAQLAHAHQESAQLKQDRLELRTVNERLIKHATVNHFGLGEAIKERDATIAERDKLKLDLVELAGKYETEALERYEEIQRLKAQLAEPHTGRIAELEQLISNLRRDLSNALRQKGES